MTQIREHIKKITEKSEIKREKRYRYGFPKMMYKYRYLRPYIKQLLELNDWENKLMFDIKKEDATVEDEYARLMLIRVHDFSQGITAMIGCDCYYSIFPLMRALCESAMVLSYVTYHPEEIKKIMSKGVYKPNMGEIRKWISPEFISYYNYLSTIHHTNAISIKMNYYEVQNADNLTKEGTAIFMIPRDYMNQYENFVLSLRELYALSLLMINFIMAKEWKDVKSLYENH